jgi:hypothetical protein
LKPTKFLPAEKKTTAKVSFVYFNVIIFARRWSVKDLDLKSGKRFPKLNRY